VTGFVRGYQRLWSGVDASQNQGQNILFLYQFQSAVGASGYAGGELLRILLAWIVFNVQLPQPRIVACDEGTSKFRVTQIV